MKKLAIFLLAGLCTTVLAGCETSGGGGYGDPYGGGIYEGPVRSGGAVVVVAPDRRGDRIDPRYRDGRYERVRDVRRDGRDDRRDSRDRDGRYGDGRDGDGRDGDRRGDDRRYESRGDRGRGDPCLDLPGYDPRYDRCSR